MIPQTLARFLGNEYGLRVPRWKNYALHVLHRSGLRRFRERLLDVGGGVKIAVRQGTHDSLIVREVWEEEIYALDGIQFGPDDLVIDIGAQIGSFSLYAAARGARVLAFEPCPMNLRQLRANVDRNALGHRIEVHGHAVGRPGTPRMRLFQSYTNLGGHSSLGWLGPAVDVECTSLPEILSEAQARRCRVLKVDVEGAEGAVLFGAGAACLERVDWIFAEMIDHPSVAADHLAGEPANDSAGVVGYLEGLGFDVEYDGQSKVVFARRAPGSQGTGHA